MDSTDIKTRLFARCSNTDLSVNLVDFVENLLLFEDYILQSVRLTEIQHFIGSFGLEGVLDLLSSDSIKIQCDALTVGQIGQTMLSHRRGKKPLQLGMYSFAIVQAAYHDKYVEGCLNDLDKINGLSPKEIESLKSALIQKIIKYPSSAGDDILRYTIQDIENNIPSIKVALKIKLENKLNKSIDSNLIHIRIHTVDKNEFKAESNLEEQFGVDARDSHNLVESALIAIAGTNQRIQDMKIYSALTSFNDQDLPVFEEKLNFLQESLAPEPQKRRLKRVLALSGFPDLGESIERRQIKIDKLLEVRESAECKDFRQWLRSSDSLDDNQVKERISSLKDKISIFAQSNVGKTLRWLVTTGLGFIPGAGIPLSAADSFLIDKILPKAGPVSFLNNKYPSIFEKGLSL